jgi:4'-phosphopantetheinyl transferase
MLCWIPAHPHRQIDVRDVHVWLADLDQRETVVQSMVPMLSSEERARAARFHFARDRRCFIVAHGMMRTVLAGYLGVTPQEVRFVVDQYGKPALASGQSQLTFNLSHSGSLALLACSLDRALGIDIEYMRALDDIDLIASHFFAPRERLVLSQMASGQKLQAFYACWTRKEAYIKAIGLGLAMPLESFAVSLASGEDARLLWVAGQPRQLEQWQIATLAPIPTYAAALVVAGSGWNLSCWQWQNPLTHEHEGG